VREDWHNGYEEHQDIICDIVTLLGEVFHSAIERGENLVEAHQICGNKLHIKFEWGDMDSFDDCAVEHLTSKNIYNGYPKCMLRKMWRDLALKWIVKKDQATLDAITKQCLKPNKHPTDALASPILKPPGFSSTAGLHGISLKMWTRPMKRARMREHDNAIIHRLNKLTRISSPLERKDRAAVEDEWDGGDEEMQKTRTVLKKLLQLA
jgi:hypothetical protein